MNETVAFRNFANAPIKNNLACVEFRSTSPKSELTTDQEVMDKHYELSLAEDMKSFHEIRDIFLNVILSVWSGLE